MELAITIICILIGGGAYYAYSAKRQIDFSKKETDLAKEQARKEEKLANLDQDLAKIAEEIKTQNSEDFWNNRKNK